MQLAFEQDTSAWPVEERFTHDFLVLLHKQYNDLGDMPNVGSNFEKILRQCCKKYRVTLGKPELHAIYQKWVNTGRVAPSPIFEAVTRTRAVRSWSGVLPISVATDGNTFSCAYDCHFCPNECKALGAPRDISRSYLSSEGTFIRGAIENFDGCLQVWRRLLELELMGHPPDKCEMIILGGTWDCYPPKYRDQFITELFYACNTYHRISIRMKGDLSPLTQKWLTNDPFVAHLAFDNDHSIRSQLRPIKTLQEEKEENSCAPCARIIGIVLETRPDQINRHSLMRKRKLGCTRIQLGIQHTDDAILEKNNRGHGVAESVRANWEARDAGFKVDGHIMPDMPGTTRDKDMEMLHQVFCGDTLQLDYCKLYPCLDLPYTKSREWKHSGLWQPMAEHNFEDFLDVMCEAVSLVPPWTRINRVQRDFPEAQEKNGYLGFVSENIRSNLQEMVMNRLLKRGLIPVDIRSREIKNQFEPRIPERARPFARAYRANNGTELFLSVEIPEAKPKNPDHAKLLGLLRLRLPDPETNHTPTPKHYLPDFDTSVPTARIRELHVYGNLVEVSRQSKGRAQHSGVGKFLMGYAEMLSTWFGFGMISVISGVGVRQYYENLGYKLTGEGEYMVKALGKHCIAPQTLFGREWSAGSLIAPISCMHIPRTHLKCSSLPMTIAVGKSLSPWWCTYSYPKIQDGKPQLVIIHPLSKLTEQLPMLVILLVVFVAVVVHFLLQASK